MSQNSSADRFGSVVGPAALKFVRRLPGTAVQVWAYLTEGGLRKKWLAAGPMDLRPGGAFELIWRNDELTEPPGIRPDGHAAENRMKGQVLAVEPPCLLEISWGERGSVRFELEDRDGSVLLTVEHVRISDRGSMVQIGAGWHTHLDILHAIMVGGRPEPFWDQWSRLAGDYESLVPAAAR